MSRYTYIWRECPICERRHVSNFDLCFKCETAILEQRKQGN